MKQFLLFRNWSLSVKVAFVLGLASTIPLAVMAYLDINNEQELIISDTTNLLVARGDQVAGELDIFNRTYMRRANRLARDPNIIRYAQTPTERERLKSSVLPSFITAEGEDETVRGISILDGRGNVLLGTEKGLIGKNFAFYGYVQEALRGSQIISDVHIAGAESNFIPTIAYLTPVKGANGAVAGVVVFWIRASSMWKILETWHAKAGEGSFSVLFGSFGVRIGHSYNKDILFRPAGALDARTVDAMVAEKRFGDKTRELLEDIKSFPAQFDLSKSSSPGRDLFRGFAPVNQKWNYGVPRRLETVHWTLFYMIPEDSLNALTASMIQRAMLVSGVIIFFAFVIGITFASRTLVKPLQEITGTAEQIATGDLTVNISSSKRSDEVGKLTQAFSRMIRSLQGTASVAQRIAAGDLTVTVEPQSENDVLGNAFRMMVESLQKITREIREGVSVVGSSGSEIMAATTQVASGVAETATSVSETTTTVEEVKQTAQVSSQKAKYVLENAQKVSQASQSGKKSVEELIEGMSRIRGHMESIAESITRLSEQGQAIGEIIATVNDLTEQSNLLAVNAAIEAAKAGEQGKGFAVVAQEVRSLAEQSKQATSQIRAILNDIQKATSGAVMATEQGSKAVEVGVKQSTTAGESIRMLSDGIAEAAQAATQIAASSQQQTAGMDQVASAMESIRQASSQNVASTKQAEMSAKMLHELGQKLQQVVERYKLPSQERA